MRKLKTTIGKSEIQGKGLMAAKDLKAGENIGVAHINDWPTKDIGENYNHSDNPNSISKKVGNKRLVLPLRNLKKGEEITVDYRQQPELEQPEGFGKPNIARMMQDGGPSIMDGMSRGRMAIAAELGNPAAKRMLSPNPKTGMTPEGEGTHYMASMGKYAVPLLQDKGGPELEYNENPKPSSEDIKFNTPEEAEYFAENYKKHVPESSALYGMQDGGGTEPVVNPAHQATMDWMNANPMMNGDKPISLGKLNTMNVTGYPTMNNDRIFVPGASTYNKDQYQLATPTEGYSGLPVYNINGKHVVVDKDFNKSYFNMYQDKKLLGKDELFPVYGKGTPYQEHSMGGPVIFDMLRGFQFGGAVLKNTFAQASPLSINMQGLASKSNEEQAPGFGLTIGKSNIGGNAMKNIGLNATGTVDVNAPYSGEAPSLYGKMDLRTDPKEVSNGVFGQAEGRVGAGVDPNLGFNADFAGGYKLQFANKSLPTYRNEKWKQGAMRAEVGPELGAYYRSKGVDVASGKEGDVNNTKAGLTYGASGKFEVQPFRFPLRLSAEASMRYNPGAGKTIEGGSDAGKVQGKWQPGIQVGARIPLNAFNKPKNTAIRVPPQKETDWVMNRNPTPTLRNNP